jgi:WD40 repeat protein
MFRTNEQPYVNAVDWSPDETRIAVAGRQADAMLFDAHCQLVRSLKAAEDGEVNYARFHPDGRILITVGNHGHIARWDAVTGDPLAPARTTAPSSIYNLAFAPDRREFAVASNDGRPRIWNLDTLEDMLTVSDGAQRGVVSVAYNPAGTLLLGASEDGNAYVWEVATGKRVAVLPHTQEVHDAWFARNGRWIFTAVADGRTCSWDSTTFHRRYCVPGHNGAYIAANIHSFAAGLDPSQQFLITATADHAATVYEAETGQILFDLRDHAENVQVAQLATCPDGLCAVTAGSDNAVKWWSIPTGALRPHEIVSLSTIPQWLAGTSTQSAR